MLQGRHYLTKQEINALYFATYQMPRPRGWNHPIPADAYWRAALVLFFNYGLDTGTVWGTKPKHEPILWRHVSWKRQSPDSQANEQSQYGWLFYRRVKTGKTFYRPMNRVVHIHLKKIMSEGVAPESPVFLGGSSRPNLRFQNLCDLANIRKKEDIETGEEKPWLLKDLRKTCGHLLRSACSRIINRDPWSFRRWHNVPPLRSPNTSRLQSYNYTASTLSFYGLGSRARQSMSMLSSAI